MNTQISVKLAALAVALMMNSLIMGGVAYVFNGQFQQHVSVPALAGTASAASAAVDGPV